MNESRNIIDPSTGKPFAEPPKDTSCPQCGAPKERRRASSGFGRPHPVCGDCGHEWLDEVWQGHR